MSKGTLRYRKASGWNTKPPAQIDLNRLSAAEVDDNFLRLDEKIDTLESHTTYNFNLAIDTANAAQSDAAVVGQTLINEVGKLEAAIATARLANANDVSAVATNVSVLSANITKEINRVQQTVSAVNATVTQAQATADGKASLADFRTLQTTVGVNKASADTKYNLLTSEISAEVSKREELDTTVGQNTAKVSTLQQAVNGISAQYAVSIVTDANGVKKVAGIRLMSDGEATAFDVLADTFRVSLPDGTGSKQVFTIVDIDGVSTLAIDGEMIAGKIRNSDSSSFFNLNIDGSSAATALQLGGGNFRVLGNGSLYANNAYIRGDIQATSITTDTVTTGNIIGGAVSSVAWANSNIASNVCSVQVTPAYSEGWRVGDVNLSVARLLLQASCTLPSTTPVRIWAVRGLVSTSTVESLIPYLFTDALPGWSHVSALLYAETIAGGVTHGISLVHTIAADMVASPYTYIFAAQNSNARRMVMTATELKR